MTAAEQVAILDGQLERGTGEFDEIILQERDEARRSSRGRGGNTRAEEQAGGIGDYGSGENGNGGSDSGNGGFQVPPIAGGSSGGGGGGGMGGPEPRPGYDPEIPEQVAVYDPPADIPDGTDDDVVARQLREAAMREPDPELREKLWDEYRKYKGID